MELHFTGIIIAVSTFLIIGLFHPIVIKTEYYTGTRYWWVFLVLGFATIAAAFLIEDVLLSAIHGVLEPPVFGASVSSSSRNNVARKDGFLKIPSASERVIIRMR